MPEKMFVIRARVLGEKFRTIEHNAVNKWLSFKMKNISKDQFFLIFSSFVHNQQRNK